jgi:hypothetical protein
VPRIAEHFLREKNTSTKKNADTISRHMVKPVRQ